jgi:C1A family cysteine protease
MGRIVEAAQFQRIRNGKWISKLHQFNIRHVEQLGSLFLSPTGRQALQALDLDVDMDRLEEATGDYLKQVNIPGLRLGKEAGSDARRPKYSWNQRGVGYLLPADYPSLALFSDVTDISSTDEDDDEAGQGSGPDLDASLPFLVDFEAAPADRSNHLIYPQGQLPQVKDQKYRGTCVAFTATALLEAFVERHVPNFSRVTDFSEQYLYFRAKKADPEKIEDGTRFHFALAALRKFGVCANSYLTYRGYNDWGHSLLFDTNQFDLTRLNKLASGTRIRDYWQLPRTNIIDTIKKCLLRDLAVGVGVPVFEDAWFNDYSIQVGEIELPIVSEDSYGQNYLMDTPAGGHAIAIYGYENDDDPETGRPGGGGFVFRNSWGEDWASSSPHAVGYGVIPYAYIERWCLDAWVITALA